MSLRIKNLDLEIKKIKFKINSNHSFYINRFIIVAEEELNKYGGLVGKIKEVFLPVKQEKFTVLRSPHVDKKARDQFERTTHKRLLKVSFLTTDYNWKEDQLRLRRLIESANVGLLIVEHATVFSNNK